MSDVSRVLVGIQTAVERVVAMTGATETRMAGVEHRLEQSADKLSEAIERLIRLEQMPSRLDRIEHDIGALRNRYQEDFSKLDRRVARTENNIITERAADNARADTTQRHVSIASWVFEHWLKIAGTFAAAIWAWNQGYLTPAHMYRPSAGYYVYPAEQAEPARDPLELRGRQP